MIKHFMAIIILMNFSSALHAQSAAISDTVFQVKKDELCKRNSFHTRTYEVAPLTPDLFDSIDKQVTKFNSLNCKKITDDISLLDYLLRSQDNCNSACSANATKKDLADKCRNICEQDYMLKFYIHQGYNMGVEAQSDLCKSPKAVKGSTDSSKSSK